jgi:dihydrofolate synthase/folylpolyglutamate synthase
VFRAVVGRLARAFDARPGAGFRTTFEHLTALAFLGFQEAGVQRAVIEVGLGGRLDATNIIPPGLAVLTPVSRDHHRILGNTVRAIAADKAHILKRGGSALIMPQSPSAWSAVQARLRRERVPHAFTRDRVKVDLVEAGEAGSRWRIEGREAYGTVATRLLGRHQGENLAAAVAAAESLLPEERLREAVRRGCRGVVVPGRLQALRRRGRTWVVDGGHNPAAGRAVARALDLHFPGRRIAAVIGMARDKDQRGYLAALAPRVQHCVMTASGNPRAADPEALARSYPGRCSVRRDAADALTLAASGEPDVALVAGSYILVGEVLRLLGRPRV